MDAQQKQIIQESTDKLLSMLGVSAPFEITEGEESVEIVLQTEEENGMLIGYHGETLEALQLLLCLIVAKKLGTFVRISVEVGEYKKNRMEYLQQLVERTKEQVVAEGQSIPLPELKSWERRFVHMLLKDDATVTSQSEGQGRDRVLTISPK